MTGPPRAAPASSARAAAPWLSVVIPSYRGERWISAALASLAAEDTTGIDVLLVDGSPTSDTLDLAREFSGVLRLQLFSRPDLGSWHAKTNFAVAAAESAHLCWLGVDDVWLPGRVAAARRWIDAAPQAPLHLAPSAIIDARGQRLGVWRCPLPAECDLDATFVNERLLVQNFIGAPAPIFRKDAWQRCAGVDETLWYTADWDLWLKLAALGTTRYHREVTIGFRVHAGSLTATGSRSAADFRRQMQIVLERHLAAMRALAADAARAAATIARTERAARASIEVNTALAAAAAGSYAGLGRAAWRVLALGPAGVFRYLRDSRIAERLLPRLRAKFAGRL